MKPLSPLQTRRIMRYLLKVASIEQLEWLQGVIEHCIRRRKNAG
ncbi:hypothetical protein [Gordoniibacillus kamchatkensis]|nr:hypothetical protein [Paenibacillus sp. VKM B-2647]